MKKSLFNVIYGWALVSIVGFFGILGWIFDISVAKAINPNWEPMTGVIAICFLLIGVTGTILKRFSVIATALAILTTCLCSYSLGIETEMLLFAEHPRIPFLTGAVEEFHKRNGIPSLVTLLLIMNISWYLILRIEGMPRKKSFGVCLGIFTSFPLVGYIFNTPILMFYVSGVSAAMALHTAIAFIIIALTINEDNRKIVKVWNNE